MDYSKWIYGKSATPYLDSYNKYAQEQTNLANQQIADMESRRDADLNKSNAQYNGTAKQNYINYMQAQKNLASQLNSLGIRGGASESSAIRLNTNYGSNVAANEAARNNAADSIRSAYAQQIANRRNELTNLLSQAQTTAEENQVKFEKEEMQRDLEQFSSVIEGLYKSKDSYEKLIAKLKKSKDPSKKMKIMLATRAMNQLSSGSSGGGGGGGRSRGYGGGGGYGGSYSNSNGNDGGNSSPKKKVTLTHSSQSSAYGGSVPSSSKSKSSTNRRHGGSSNSVINWWKRYTR